MVQITPELQEAIARRRGGQAPTTSPVGQVQRPSAPLPTGGANTPTVQPPQATGGEPKTTVDGRVGQASLEDRLAKEAGVVQGPAFDEETRKLSKALVKKLIEAM